MSSLINRRLWAYERGYNNHVDVPGPIYAQGLLMNAVSYELKSHYVVLLKGLEDRPENYLRIKRADADDRMFLVDLHHPISKLMKAQPSYHESEIARLVPFLHGRIHMKWMDLAYAGKLSYDDNHAIPVFVCYLNRLARDTRMEMEWWQPFDQFVNNLPNSADKSHALYQINAGVFDRMFQQMDGFKPAVINGF